jgi:hypothetical protein
MILLLLKKLRDSGYVSILRKRYDTDNIRNINNKNMLLSIK